jgi:hypothetical protein
MTSYKGKDHQIGGIGRMTLTWYWEHTNMGMEITH